MATALLPPADPGTFRALRHRNYRLYFIGQIISLTGSWVQTAALTWLAYTLTEGSSLPARVTAAQVVPSLLLGAWGGSLADRLPKRSLIFASQAVLLLLAMALAGMVAFGLVSPVALLAAAVLIGVVNAIDTPARLAFVVDMVGRDDLMNAVALNSLVFNVARVVGPALGMLALPWVGLAGCFFLNGLTFVAVLGALAAMRLPAKGPTPARDIRLPVGGFRHLAGHPGLLLLLALAGAMAFFGWPVLALLPALSDQSLAAGSEGYAWMLSASSASALSSARCSSRRSAPGAPVAADRGGRGRRPGLAVRTGAVREPGGGVGLLRGGGVRADPLLRHGPGDDATRRGRTQSRAGHGHLAHGPGRRTARREPRRGPTRRRLRRALRVGGLGRRYRGDRRGGGDSGGWR